VTHALFLIRQWFHQFEQAVRRDLSAFFSLTDPLMRMTGGAQNFGRAVDWAIRHRYWAIQSTVFGKISHAKLLRIH